MLRELRERIACRRALGSSKERHCVDEAESVEEEEECKAAYNVIKSRAIQSRQRCENCVVRVLGAV